MNKINLIIRQEYLNRIRKRSFLLMCLLMPFLFVASIYAPYWLSEINKSEIKEITVLDYTGLYKNMFTDMPPYRFNYQAIDDPSKNTKTVDVYIIISDDLLQNPEGITICSAKQIDRNFKEHITLQAEKYLENEKLASYQIPNIQEIIAASQVKLNISETRLGENDKYNYPTAEIPVLIGIASTFIIYLFLLLYGVQVMQSVTQEKSSRMVEIIISSIKPFELMTGKIIAIGLAGLTQFAIWGILTIMIILMSTPPIGANTSPDSTLYTEIISQMQIYPFAGLLTGFLLFFIGGYMLYASLFAAIGSTVDNESDAQPFMAPVTIIILFALYAGIYSAQNPEGALAFWCSMIPFTSPIVMMVRLPFGIPLWEIILSLSILFISAFCCIWISGRIYRIGILMYGKRPSCADLLKWIKYKG